MPLDERLTIIVPTHNRPERLRALVTFLRDCGVPWKIMVADSSKSTNTEIARLGVAHLEYRYYGDNHPFLPKLLDAVSRVTTPFTVMLPDDDITLPHALEASLRFLINHPEFVVAYGYIFDFAIHETSFDIVRVRWFTPNVDETDPLARMYHLVRRYQPFFWAVFKTPILINALKAGDAQGLIVLQEMAFMNAAVLRGKVARLPVIFNLRGTDESMTPVEKTNPFYAFLSDAANFAKHYARYRDYLVALTEQPGASPRTPLAAALAMLLPFRRRHEAAARRKLKQLIDLIHLVSFSREIDAGVANREVQVLLGWPISPSRPASVPYAWRPPQERDLVHASDGGGPTFVWRREIFEAEPKEEINVSPEEIAATERELRFFPTPVAAPQSDQ